MGEFSFQVSYSDQRIMKVIWKVCLWIVLFEFLDYFSHSAKSLAVNTTANPVITSCLEEDKPKDPCLVCECMPNQGWQWGCYVIECYGDPPCVDGYIVTGKCCQVCPTGPNCLIEGVIVRDGNGHTKRNGDTCYCPRYSFEPIICLTPPTTTMLTTTTNTTTTTTTKPTTTPTTTTTTTTPTTTTTTTTPTTTTTTTAKPTTTTTTTTPTTTTTTTPKLTTTTTTKPTTTTTTTKPTTTTTTKPTTTKKPTTTTTTTKPTTTKKPTTTTTTTPKPTTTTTTTKPTTTTATTPKPTTTTTTTKPTTTTTTTPKPTTTTTTTTTKPTTTTTTTTTTARLTPYCKDEDNPSTSPCYVCHCDEGSGYWNCYVEECFFPICVDGYIPPGQCCHVCPNGQNCLINGKIVPFGQSSTMPNGDICSCAETLSGDLMCFTPTTTTATTLAPSLLPPPSYTPKISSTCQDQPINDPCAYCMCENFSGVWEWVCWMQDCMQPPCVDPARPPGECCPVCPNGPNCLIDGKIISFDQSYVMKNGDTCRCNSGDSNDGHDKYSCVPATTTPSPKTTTTERQCDLLRCDNNDPILKDPCNHCICACGMWLCCGEECSTMPCVDEYKPPGRCCPICPNGPNCLIDGKIVSFDQSYVMKNGDTCRCNSGDSNDGHDNYSCVPATTTPSPKTTTTERQCDLSRCDKNDPILKDPCNHCICACDMWLCCGEVCSTMPCVDEYKPPGQCCPICPNGPNCLINGYIVPQGHDNVMKNGDICSCLYSHGEDKPPEIFCVSPQDPAPK